MTKHHAPITRLYKQLGYGFVLTPGSWETPFYASALAGCDIDDLRPGMEVNFELSEERFPKVSGVTPVVQLRMAS